MFYKNSFTEAEMQKLVMNTYLAYIVIKSNTLAKNTTNGTNTVDVQVLQHNIV